MKKIFIIAMLLISSVSIAQQYKYHKGQTIVVDSSLTICNITQVLQGATWVDIKNKDWTPQNNNYGKLGGGRDTEINNSCINVKPNVDKIIISIFKEVFTNEELRRLMVSPKISKGEYMSFIYFVDKLSNPYKMRMHFSLNTPLNDMNPVQVGQLYKLMYEKIRFDVTDGGLGCYILDFQIYLKQVVEGTLNLGEDIRDMRTPLF